MQHRRFFTVLLGVLVALSCAAVPAWGQSVPRKVLAEDFAATWCVPCRDVGTALRMLQDDHPDSLIAMQVHLQDAYQVPWGLARGNAYGIPWFPFVWFDGALPHENGDVGSVEQCYNALHSLLTQREAVTTDVSVEVWAEQTGADTYKVFARVGVEPGGTSKTMRTVIVQTLKDYPVGQTYYFNCVMDGYTGVARPVVAGETLTTSRTFTLTGPSAANPENVQFIAWAEAATSGAAETYNAEVLGFPFVEAAPCPPDLDGDGSVAFLDLLAVLSAWGPCTGCPEDINENGEVEFNDLLAILSAWGDCP